MLTNVSQIFQIQNQNNENKHSDWDDDPLNRNKKRQGSVSQSTDSQNHCIGDAQVEALLDDAIQEKQIQAEANREARD